MSEELPAPLVPADIDLRDFPYMPLDVARLRDSRLAGALDAEIFRASVLSWCVAWHQLPSGSLPDDDAELAWLLGYGRDLRTWRRVRANDGLHGWVKCSDGRLYHPVVAEKVLEACKKRASYSNRGKAGASKRWGERDGSATELPLAENGKGIEGKRREEKDSPAPRKRAALNVTELQEFEAWYAIYPSHVGRLKAEAAFAKARKRASQQQLIDGAKRYAASIRDPKYVAHPATWLNAGRWLDEPPAANGHDQQRRPGEPYDFSAPIRQYRTPKSPPPAS